MNFALEVSFQISLSSLKLELTNRTYECWNKCISIVFQIVNIDFVSLYSKDETYGRFYI